MTHASLFSGIGGFELAAEWAGWTNVFNCEIDPFCRTVLKHHFPNAEQYTDIRATDFTLWRGRVDVLTGGFPCQPFSVAGKRKGTEDERHLWPEMLRAIGEIQPRWVVGENVRGIINWSGGLVFEQVCSDLEAAGYEVQPFVIPACGVNAPHRRDRVWFVAHTNSSADLRGPRKDASQSGEEWIQEWHKVWQPNKSDDIHANQTIPDTKSTGLEARTKRSRQKQSGGTDERVEFSDHWKNFPTQPPVCSRDDGFSERLDGITFPKWREQSIKAYGNAVVPQVVLQIFEVIKQ